MPPIPDLPGLHPLAVHFPIALLYAAPLFILLGLLDKPQRRAVFFLSAWILMLLGTAGAFIASLSGEAAARLASPPPDVKAILEQHEELAETTRLFFSILAAIFAAMLFLPRLRKRPPGRAVTTLLPLVFLVLYGAGMVILADTAHHGGRLVHEFGLHAVLGSSPSAAIPPPG